MNKYIRITQPGLVEVCDGDIPRPKKGEALLEMLYGGICGSDLSSFRGTSPYITYPQIPGHEFSARIVQVEENDYGLLPGMIVTANPYYACGACYSCQRGMLNCCMYNQTMGVQRQGAFSQYFTLPLERIYNGNGIDPRTLALVEPFCIAYHGVKRAVIKENEKVLVVGAGTIGVLAAIAAQKSGAQVTICDVSEEKVVLAKRNGIQDAFLSSDPSSFRQNVQRITDEYGFDVTIEAVGLPSTFQSCIDAAAFGGRVIQIGVGKESLDFNFTILQKKELKVMGSRNALEEDFREVISLISGHGLEISGVITNEYSMSEAPRAFSEYSAQSGRMLKVLIKF